ncbi:MAG: stalk domain-containing protein [Peptostreptococcaceae bacterium]|nr:stalk domain-containing protein [Peptostreptococcaceae bacterium]
MRKLFTTSLDNHKDMLIKILYTAFLCLICLSPLTGYTESTQNFVEVSTFEELKRELEKNTPQSILIQENISMTANIKISSDHSLQIADGKTLSTDNFQISVPKEKTLTLGTENNPAQGRIIIRNFSRTAIYSNGNLNNHLSLEIEIPDDKFLSNGVSGIYCNGIFQNGKNSFIRLKGNFGQSSGLNINGKFILNDSRMILENSGGNGLWIAKKEDGFSMQNSTVEIKTSAGKPFYFQNASTVLSVHGESKFILHSDAKFNFAQIISDRGKIFSSNTVTTVLPDHALAGENHLTAGEYVWNGAHFEKTCDITLDSQGGTLTENKLKTDSHGKLHSLPAPEKDGFEFKGWYTEQIGGNKIDLETIFLQSSTIFAQWEQISTPTNDEEANSEKSLDDPVRSSVRPDPITDKNISTPLKEKGIIPSRQTFFVKIGSKNYRIQKENRSAEYSFDTAPILHNGKTLLPVKTVADILDLTPEFDSKNKVIRLFYQNDERKKELPIMQWFLSHKKIREKEENYPAAQDILNINGRVFISAADMQLVAQKVGINLKIQWENNTKQLILSYENYNP